PGGTTTPAGAVETVPAATVLSSRLVVRRRGRTVDAALQALPSAAALVHPSPGFPLTAQVSGDGHYLHVAPDGFLTPGREYAVRVRGLWTSDGIPLANTVIGGLRLGTVDDTVRVRVAPARGPLPLRVGPRS